MTLKHTYTSRPLSLVNPNLSGLWSTVHLGQENDICTILRGAAAVLFIIYPWMMGFSAPIFIFTLFCYGYTTTALLGLTILIYPYIVRVQPWLWWQQFIIGVCGYFEGGMSVSFEHEIDFDDPILFCVHPHGLFCFGSTFSAISGRVLTDQAFTASKPKLLSRLAACALVDAKVLSTPIFKHIIIGWVGGAGSFRCASKKSMIKLLKDKILSLYLMPGGFNELALLKKDCDGVCIKNRKGFIKYALQYGCNVLPAYTFGECSTYNTLLNEQSKVKTWLSNHRIPCVLPYGPFSWCLSILPYRKNVGVHTIYGNLKKFPEIRHPTTEDVETYHKWYVDELVRIFNDNKWRFGITRELVIM
eukprot:CAMPEP_0202688628 /NCGR_PEP_ID=MMETSP1385-20130828/4111_1 /ASSEMBLY_ACC=CAM_ASM_000861 /TAXON_ID=933848 /ORGANISM="Elphidium margaritaceum" /LENGTH=358 /DNA_ID=CAMNT_0049343647 /DNA_START=48 /DNA_END=1124 /DNA_ORIENTATION=+